MNDTDTARIQHVESERGDFDVLLLDFFSAISFSLDSYGEHGVTLKVSRPSAALLAALRKALGPEPGACGGENRCDLGGDCPCYQAGQEDRQVAT